MRFNWLYNISNFRPKMNLSHAFNFYLISSIDFYLLIYCFIFFKAPIFILFDNICSSSFYLDLSWKFASSLEKKLSWVLLTIKRIAFFSILTAYSSCSAWSYSPIYWLIWWTSYLFLRTSQASLRVLVFLSTDITCIAILIRLFLRSLPLSRSMNKPPWCRSSIFLNLLSSWRSWRQFLWLRGWVKTGTNWSYPALSVKATADDWV